MTSHKFNFNHLYLSKEKQSLHGTTTTSTFCQHKNKEYFTKYSLFKSLNMILLWNEMDNAEISGCFLLLE